MRFNAITGYLRDHLHEIIWAAFFALFFWLISELLNPESRMRAAIRRLNNRWSEHSAALLAKRIKQLQDYQKQLTDPRWQYLFAFQILFIILLVFSIGASFLMLSLLYAAPLYPDLKAEFLLFALCSFASGGGVALIGFSHVWRDTPEKVQTLVRRVGVEIEGLQKTLSAYSKHDSASE
jgi:uncharacterized membrane protein